MQTQLTSLTQQVTTLTTASRRVLIIVGVLAVLTLGLSVLVGGQVWHPPEQGYARAVGTLRAAASAASGRAVAGDGAGDGSKPPLVYISDIIYKLAKAAALPVVARPHRKMDVNRQWLSLSRASSIREGGEP